MFIYLFLAVLGLRCCAWAFSSWASGGYSSLQCVGFSLRWLLLLRSTGSRHEGFSSCGSWALECRLSSYGSRAKSTGSVVVVYGLSCSTLCGISPDQRLNPCPLHWQVVSQPLCHQGSPTLLHNDSK